MERYVLICTLVVTAYFVLAINMTVFVKELINDINCASTIMISYSCFKLVFLYSLFGFETSNSVPGTDADFCMEM